MLAPLALLAACGGGGGGGNSGRGDDNPPPTNPDVTGQADTITITAGDPTATGNVLSNDTARSGTLSVSAVNVQGGANGTVGQAIKGVYGTLIVNRDGSYSYTLDNNDPDTQALDAGEVGYDAFSYSIRDDQAAVSSATLVIEVQGTGTGGGQGGVIGGTTIETATDMGTSQSARLALRVAAPPIFCWAGQTSAPPPIRSTRSAVM